MRPSYPLYPLLIDWNTYSPHINHDNTAQRHTPRQYITAFRNSIRHQSSSVTTSYPLITSSLTITDNPIIKLLDTYNSPLILTIDESFKPPATHHVYTPRHPQHLTFAHVTASVTIAALNNSHPRHNEWICRQSRYSLAFNLSPLYTT